MLQNMRRPFVVFGQSPDYGCESSVWVLVLKVIDSGLSAYMAVLPQRQSECLGLSAFDEAIVKS